MQPLMKFKTYEEEREYKTRNGKMMQVGELQIADQEHIPSCAQNK